MSQDTLIQIILSILNKELGKQEQYALEYKDGMETFLKELQDSDYFYNEASALGAIDSLQRVKNEIEKLTNKGN